MENLWFNPKEPVGYSGVSRLAKAAKTTKKQTAQWLGKQLAYSLNRPMRRRFPTRKYRARGINALWQMDLMEMIPYARINKGYRYILTCIDVFSRYARAVPVKSKSAKDMVEAVESMLEDTQPKSLQTDLGKEFYNGSVKNVLNAYGINHYSVFSQYKAALVERFNRTLRGRLGKYFIKIGKKVWIDVLPKIIHAYNHSEHRGLNGMRPIDVVTTMDDLNTWLMQYDEKRRKKKRPKYKIGDFVRISKISTTPFIKNFDNNWSDEVFEIVEINTKQIPVMYVIRDEDGNVIQGKFYEEELQVLPEKPNIYRIQSILQTKGKDKHKQYLVKWHGYETPTWIYANQIEQ